MVFHSSKLSLLNPNRTEMFLIDKKDFEISTFFRNVSDHYTRLRGSIPSPDIAVIIRSSHQNVGVQKTNQSVSIVSRKEEITSFKICN